MHLRNVEIFCDVVTRRSFSKAAEANHVSQSSASQAVHMLEKRLGMSLIDRSKRPLELTPAGKVYFDGCRDLLESFRKIEDSVQRMENKVVGRVRIAAIYSVGLLQMSSYVRRYRELYPDVKLHLDYLHPDEVYDRILVDDADLGLVSFPREGGEISRIIWQQQPMVLVVYPEHRLARESAVSVRDLQDEDFVGFRSELAIRRHIDRWLKQSKVNVKVIHEFDNIENIKRAVEIGSGVAILPVPTVKRETDLKSLVAIPFCGVEWFRPLGVVHRRHRALTSAVSKFIELLHEDPDAVSYNLERTPGQNGDSATGLENTREPALNQPAAR